MKHQRRAIVVKLASVSQNTRENITIAVTAPCKVFAHVVMLTAPDALAPNPPRLYVRNWGNMTERL